MIFSNRQVQRNTTLIGGSARQPLTPLAHLVREPVAARIRASCAPKPTVGGREPVAAQGKTPWPMHPVARLLVTVCMHSSLAGQHTPVILVGIASVVLFALPCLNDSRHGLDAVARHVDVDHVSQDPRLSADRRCEDRPEVDQHDADQDCQCLPRNESLGQARRCVERIADPPQGALSDHP